MRKRYRHIYSPEWTKTGAEAEAKAGEETSTDAVYSSEQQEESGIQATCV